MPQPPTPLTRLRAGRVLGGVCAGVARRRGAPVGRVRAVAVLLGLAGGIGVLAYVACWLILPAEGDQERSRSGAAVIAQLAAACAALLTLAAASGAATIFGYGGVVIVLAAAALGGVLAGWRRFGPGWALLPLAALVVPSLAVAAGGVRVAPSLADAVVAPATAADIPAGGYRSGLGMLLIDLRRTVLPARGTVDLRIAAGVRRTIVALPHERCVRTDVAVDARRFARDLAATLARPGLASGPTVSVFGQDSFGTAMRTRTDGDGPLLRIAFTSQGGGLVVRDYPDRLDPEGEAGWPGLPVYLEPRPDTAGTPRRAARTLLREWRARRVVQARSARTIRRLLPGPCGEAAR